MMDTLAHRGPDDDGTFAPAGDAGMLGHRRLSIMDPSCGHQPILDAARSRAIVANGEIYNFPQLRPELAKSRDFKTRSDTEAILHLYDKRGPATVKDLDGMYAFAILDDEALFLARDPIGIKPLYYGEGAGGAMLFASELKALSGRCADVREFPPGTFFHSDTGFETFYEVPDRFPLSDSVEAWSRKIADTMDACVVKRLMSDVPVGAFLSGGLDSSIIAALARRHIDDLHTFSVGIEGSPDLAAARLVSRHLDTIHHEYVLSAGEIEAMLPEIVWHLESFDQDLVRSAIPTFFTARMAKEHVEVILTGEGADELFAGYAYHKQIDGDERLHHELHRTVGALHNLNLQRVDRMTMAHAVEGRVPFLDREMIELAQLIPADMKLRGDPPEEKWILRKAFEDLLPEEVVWRKKEQFDEGTGTVDVMGEIASRAIGHEEADAHRRRHPDAALRSVEECHYHRLLLDAFEHPDPVLANVARWSHRQVGV